MPLWRPVSAPQRGGMGWPGLDSPGAVRPISGGFGGTPPRGKSRASGSVLPLRKIAAKFGPGRLEVAGLASANPSALRWASANLQQGLQNNYSGITR